MTNVYLREMEELNKLNNKLLNHLDLNMSDRIKRIRLYEPSKKDLDSLFSLYNMTIDTYKKDSSLYKLNPLKYTDLSEVKNILINYGYLKPELLKQESDNKRPVSNVVQQPQQENIKSKPPTDFNENKSLVSKDDNISKEHEDIFVEQKNPFNSNGPVYAFANEALNQYMKNYDFEGKSVLASLGSGDFALNAYLLGASDVETFDINQYTYYFYQLKKALIMKYNFEDFCNLIKNPQNILKKINEYKQLLDCESIVFFEHLIDIFNGDFVRLLKKVFIDKIGEEKNQWNESNTFDTPEELFLIAQYKNYYLQSSENYNKLKEQLSKHALDKFYFEDLYEFTPQKKYDIIYLSNIGDYCKSEEEFKEFVLQLRERSLNENGIIIVVSITNHIIMDSDICERTKMNWDDMEEFNTINKGKAYLPICNLGIQNVYTTYPYEIKKHSL